MEQMRTSLDWEALSAEQKEQKMQIEKQGKALRIADARTKFQSLLLNTIRLESQSGEDHWNICRTIRVSKKIKSIYFASATFPDEDKQLRSKLRSPPPPLAMQHQEDEEEERELEEDVGIENEYVEIADIAEQKKKLAMEKDEKSKSLLHSASFYGCYSGPICPQTPSKKVPSDGKWKDEEDIEGWEKDEELELETGRGGHGRLMERSDTKYCLIVSSDFRLTPRKISPSPAVSSFLAEEEEDEDERAEEEEEVKWELNEVLKEDEESDNKEVSEQKKDTIMGNTDGDSIKMINDEEEAQIVVYEDTDNSDEQTPSDSSSVSAGEEEMDDKKASSGPKKSQTEHRLVVKKDKMAKGSLVMIPLETIRKRRKQEAQKDCLEDILNYV